ncbi:helix-turn-helix domain-containing protein [Massilia alkalitolerans]|uniref:helix-turn-helix domain-containing protein n=1 Tax=Massilia alkalitolerans TaxID=286638 RepID=UPI0028AB330D|nr:helix-turn-helix domain-containing protein [Massilia alkalitolerans]
MKANELILALTRELETTSKAELAAALGVAQATLTNWEKRDKDLSASQVASALAKSRKAAVRKSQLETIRPIVELFPISNCLSSREAIWHLFDGGKNAPLYRQGVKAALDEKAGVYIFYDSRGQALYVGKTEKLSLWKEMTNAFNRETLVQEISLVSHPAGQQSFSPGHEKLRQPRPTKLKLYDLAHYFSAYHVASGMIGDLEALLVRSFANTLLNVRMETFANSRSR